jgi:agmatine/peptidylarginine deiminase
LDHLGYKIIENIFPERDIIAIPAYYQAIGGGGPGCMTQQVPVGNNISIK